MTYIGNPQATLYFHTLIDRIIQTDKIEHGFLLLCGPQYVGKMTLVQSAIPNLLTASPMQDCMQIQDFSDQRLELKESNDKLAGTNHSIKISVDDTKSAIVLSDGSLYQDYGVREMIDWLSVSPAGKRKILIIENIERMGVGAANALLKTLEEPLPDRLIICTSSNPGQLLSTIVSRGLLIQFYPVSHEEIQQGLIGLGYANHPHLAAAVYRSMGRPGLAIKLLSEPKYQQLLEIIQTITPIYLAKEFLSIKHAAFMKLHEAGLLSLALDMLQISFVDDAHRSAKFLQTKKYLDSNVGVANVMMNMLID